MISGLDGLRAIAFLLIFVVHTGYGNFGWIGVQLFFVLSGFLITGILLDMKQVFSSGEYFKKFYGRRFLRIFPLYYFYLFLMLGITFILSSQGFHEKKMEIYPRQLPYALVFLYNFYYVHVDLYSLSIFLAHFWTLSVEEQFYIFWPLMIFVFPEKDHKKLFVGAIIGGLLFRILFTVAYQIHPLSFIADGLPHGIYPISLAHLDAFGFGALLTRYKIPGARKQFLFLLFALPIIGFVNQYLSTGNISLGTLGYPYLMEDGYQFIWGYLLLNYMFAVTISAIVHERAFIRFLDWKPLVYLGKISYGLYVYHLGVIWFARSLFRDDIPGPPPVLSRFLFAAIEFLVTLLLAVLSYHFLEKPILSLKDKYFPVREQSKAAVLER